MQNFPFAYKNMLPLKITELLNVQIKLCGMVLFDVKFVVYLTFQRYNRIINSTSVFAPLQTCTLHTSTNKQQVVINSLKLCVLRVCVSLLNFFFLQYFPFCFGALTADHALTFPAIQEMCSFLVCWWKKWLWRKFPSASTNTTICCRIK